MQLGSAPSNRTAARNAVVLDGHVGRHLRQRRPVSSWPTCGSRPHCPGTVQVVPPDQLHAEITVGSGHRRTQAQGATRGKYLLPRPPNPA